MCVSSATLSLKLYRDLCFMRLFSTKIYYHLIYFYVKETTANFERL
jgi:hypothetical protein